MKIVTLCQGGNSRSVALGFVLKYYYGQDVLACSWEKNTEETKSMLFAWADRILIMETSFLQYVPTEFQKKVGIYDVGPDIWCNGLHPQLIEIVNKMVLEDPAWTIVQA